jgi:hypothetical protein
VACIPLNPQHVESKEQLLAKYRTLMSLTPHPPLPGGEGEQG